MTISEELKRKREEERRKPESLLSEIDQLSTRMDSHEQQLKGAIEEIQRLRAEISELEDRRKARRQGEKNLYILPLVAVIAFVTFLVHRGWAATPDVSIDFNV